MDKFTTDSLFANIANTSEFNNFLFTLFGNAVTPKFFKKSSWKRTSKYKGIPVFTMCGDVANLEDITGDSGCGWAVKYYRGAGLIPVENHEKTFDYNFKGFCRVYELKDYPTREEGKNNCFLTVITNSEDNELLYWYGGYSHFLGYKIERIVMRRVYTL